VCGAGAAPFEIAFGATKVTLAPSGQPGAWLFGYTDATRSVNLTVSLLPREIISEKLGDHSIVGLGKVV